MLTEQGKADMSHSQRTYVTEDPAVWVLETYPWSQPAPTPLTRLKLESADQIDHNCCQSASDRSSHAASRDNEDQLVSMSSVMLFLWARILGDPLYTCVLFNVEPPNLVQYATYDQVRLSCPN